MSVIYRLLVSILFISIAGSASALAAPSSVPPIATKDNDKIPASPDANTAYTPLLLPQAAAERGISLSGEAKLQLLEQGHYQMGCGCVLVHTDEPIFITTCRADVLARKGATIVVSAKKDVTRVLNLSDHKRDSVRVIFGKNHVSLNPGEELAVVCATASNVDKAATEYVIRYRNAQALSVSPNYKAVLFEFSLGDAMKHCLIFKQLSESPRKEDKVLLAEIIKTAAAVNTVFAGSREKYSHGENNAIASKKDSRLALKKKQPARLALNN